MRSDIYAVGATLYYLLTGRPPFDDRNLIALVSRIATELPTSPHEVRPAVPKAVAAVVLLCLAKDPSHRPASYRALVNMLEPLGSVARTPAPLGIRTAAFAFDTCFLDLPAGQHPGRNVRESCKAIVAVRREARLFHFLCDVLLCDHRGCVGRVTREGTVWPPRGDGKRRAAAIRASSPSNAHFFSASWLASGLVVSLTGLVYSMQGRSAIVGHRHGDRRPGGC